MAFFKKIQQHINKKWYPRSVLVGSPIGTEQVAKRLAAWPPVHSPTWTLSG